MLTVNQKKFITELSEKYGENTTLKELLSIDKNIPIENVEFHITGTYANAYECTGDPLDLKGNIKKILEELDSWMMFKDTKHKIKELVTKEELEELCKFFLGQSNEPNLDNIKVDMSREVKLEELIDYIGNLEVWEDFEYGNVRITF